MEETTTIKGTVKTMIRKEGTNQVFFQGIDYSNGRKPLLIVSETRQVVVVKIPGGSTLVVSAGKRTTRQSTRSSSSYPVSQLRLSLVLPSR